jgi:hypothetical protein
MITDTPAYMRVFHFHTRVVFLPAGFTFASTGYVLGAL